MSQIKREDRYLVAKRKHLTLEQTERLEALLAEFDLPPIECVVVESDWPNYEDTWTAIEQIVNGEYKSPAELIQINRELEHYCNKSDLEREAMEKDRDVVKKAYKDCSRKRAEVLERNKELEETVKRQDNHLRSTGNISAYRVAYRCRFCAAGAASDYNVKAFYNCHVCKAPAAMIPENMHAELMELLVKMDTLLAQRDQAITLLNNAMTARQQAAPRVMHQVSTALDTLRKEFDPQKIKQLQDEGLTESCHHRTPLNRLIDACPEYVQQHIWELREKVDPDEERYTREDLEDAYRQGFGFAQVRFKQRIIDSFRPTQAWRRHTLQTGLGNFLKRLRDKGATGDD